MVECRVCGDNYGYIPAHLDHHGLSIEEYRSRFGEDVPFDDRGSSSWTESCPICGDDVTVTPATDNEYNTCSRECQDKMHSQAMSGEGNPFYGESHDPSTIEKIRASVGDMTGENNPRFNGWSSLQGYPPEWTYHRRETIRLMHGHQCEDCGVPEVATGEKLHVHHIDENKQNCEIDNLVPLCRGCHARRHCQ